MKFCFNSSSQDDHVVRYNPSHPLRARNQELSPPSQGKKSKKSGMEIADNASVLSAESVGTPAAPVRQKRGPPKNPPWKVKTLKIYEGLILVGSVQVLQFKKKKAAQLVNVLSSITRHPTFHEENPEIRLPILLNYLERFRQQLSYQPQLEPLVDYLEWVYDEEVAVFDAMIANGEITFDALWYLFKTDSRFVTEEHDELVGSLVSSRDYEFSVFGGIFRIYGNHITTNGRQLSYLANSYLVSQFNGLKDIANLPVRPMTEPEYQVLYERGKVFREIATGPHYKQYSGNMFFNSGWSTEKFKASGRVMIDPTNFSRFNPDYKGQFFVHASADPNQSSHNAPQDSLKEIPDEKIFTCVPTIAGFSLTVKRWGQLHVRNISNIKFDSNAYEQLVMDQNRKQLVRSLVENSSQSFTDIISGKGGGCVFLLHGPPGTGKTLTAEAIADLLERPLYSVTVGELGVTTKDLEQKLRQILELAWEWDAVLLIDEADIFLERRCNNDIQRNAMVGIFLRLLEYHQGVLFLTSNRVKSFDDAFHSRISVALHYEAHNQDTRRQIFENLLKAAGITGLDLDEISQQDLNGRQIKNTIRLAQSLAFTEKVPVNLGHLQKTILIAKQFQDDLASPALAMEPCNL